MVLPAVAGCPFTIKCSYHNVQLVTKSETEFRNGKEYGVYEHQYYENGKQRKCRLVLECK
jgi:hypothetical protein